MGRLQTARLENFIRRWGSIKGPGSVLSETLGDVFPVLDLENLTPENDLTAGWHNFMTFATVIGGVAQLGGMSCDNVPGSNALVVLDKCIVNTVVAQDITFGVGVPLTPGVGARNRDTRSANIFEGRARLSSSANMAAQNGGIFHTGINTDYQLESPHSLAVLGPGTGFRLVQSTANETMTVTWFGRVREAEPSELSF